MLKLNRAQCYLLGLSIIFLFYFLNRSKFIIGSEKVQGTFVYYVAELDPEEGKLIYPVIEYKVNDSIYIFKGEVWTAYQLNEKLPILLQGRDPEKPLLYTLRHFWLYPLLYTLMPILFWSAFAFSYINKNEKILIDLKYPFFRKEKNTAITKA